MHGQDRFLLAGVMGWPISHSRSPKIHNYWLARYGLAGSYIPLAVEPGRLEAALRALPALNFSGCNLTIPHKEAALAVVDTLDASAKRIGAVNCVVVEEDGTLSGRNYDGFGFTASLHAAAPMWRADAGPAVVIGAGGAARAVIAGLIDAGASEVRLFNRTRERAQKIAADFGGLSPPSAGANGPRASPAPGSSSIRRIRAWSASSLSICRSTACRRMRSSPTSFMRRWRRRCWRRPEPAAISRSTGSAC